MRTIVLLCICASACSYTFDGNAPPYPLVGSGIDLMALPRLNVYPARSETFATSPGGQQWVAIVEGQNPRRGDTGNALQNPTLHEVRLDGPGDRSFKTASSVVGTHALYFVDAAMPPVLHAIDVGDMGAGETFALPTGTVAVALLPDPSDAAFVLAVVAPGMPMPSYDIVRRDGSFRRTLPIPAGVSFGAGMGGRQRAPRVTWARWNGDGTWLVEPQMGGTVIAHSATSTADTNLGMRPSLFVFDDARGAAIFADASGVRRVALDGKTPDVVLDPASARSDVLVLDEAKENVYYAVGDALWTVPLDASAPPRLVRAGTLARVRTFGPQGQVVTSTDSFNAYVFGAGDGWLGSWRFMDRGLSPQLNADGSRVYWREHAADDNGAGTLLGASVPGGASTPLALNCTQFDVLADGRVLAEANEAYLDFANRLVVVDESAGQATLVAKGISAYQLVPSSGDILAEVVTDLNGHDVVRIPVPPTPR